MRFLKTRTITSIQIFWGLVVLGLMAGGCGFRQKTQELINSVSVENLTNDQKLIENQDKGIRLTVPSSWTTVETLRPDADIYAANEAEALYVLVLADDQSSLVGQFSLEDNASQYRRLLARQLDRYDRQTPTDLNAVNGQAAVQYEIRGQIEGVDIVYLHTTIKGEAHYYQVIGWTRADRYEAQKSALETVITSFRGS
jgi:hypothetical protein